MDKGQKLLSYGCGVGDDILYAKSKEVLAFGVEVPGKLEFLRFRGVLCGTAANGIYSRSILSSILDHVPDPVGLAREVSNITIGPILATPKIDESYDRPTHQKYILKNVPAAFKVIEEHNANLQT